MKEEIRRWVEDNELTIIILVIGTIGIISVMTHEILLLCDVI